MKSIPLGTDLKPTRMNSKGKGNANEIKICKRLSKWAIGADKPLLFWRIGSSGAQATLTKDVKSKLVGDVVAIDEKGAFLTDIVVIELKDVKTTNILDFISPRKASEDIVTWWEKVSLQAADAGRYPMLIFHRLGSKMDYLVCEIDFINKLEEIVGRFERTFINHHSLIGQDRVIMELEYFLDLVTPWNFAWAFSGPEKMNLVKDNYIGNTVVKEEKA